MLRIALPMPSPTVLKICLWLAATAVVFWAFQFFDVFAKSELGVLDKWFQWRGERPASDEVVLVMVDDSTAKHYGGWPLPRKAYADLIKTLNHCGAAVIAFDLAFYDRRDTADALLLARATPQAENVLHIFEFTIVEGFDDEVSANDGAPSALRKFALAFKNVAEAKPYRASAALFPDEIFLESFDKAGYATSVQDMDGHFRRVPVAIEYAGMTYPALSLKALCEYFAISDSGAKFGGNFWGKYLELATANETLKIPVDDREQVVLNFYGDLTKFEHYSFLKVLRSVEAAQRGEVPYLACEAFAGKIVLIGLSLAGEEDPITIPYSASFPGAGFHATMISNALDESFIREAPSIANLGVIIFYCLITFGILLWQRRQEPWLLIAVGALLLVLLNAALFWLFAAKNLWFKSLQINAAIIAPVILVIVADLRFKIRQLRQHEDKIAELIEREHEQGLQINEKKQELEQLQKEREWLQNQILAFIDKLPQPPNKDIGPYQTLVLKKVNGYVEAFKIIGAKGETDFLSPGPKRLAFLYYLAMAKQSGDSEGWIVHEQTSGKAWGYFVGRVDDFLMAAEKCNYQRYHTTVEEASRNLAQKRKNYEEWSQSVLDAVEDDPGFVAQQATLINKPVKPYGGQLISPAGGRTPYALLVEKVEEI